MSFDYASWQADHLSSDQSCLSEAEAEAVEAEEKERQRIKESCARGLLQLGIVPRSFANQRFWSNK